MKMQHLQENSDIDLTGFRNVYQTAICKYHTVQPHVDNANVPPQLTLVHSRKKIQKTKVAPNNHGKIVNIFFSPSMVSYYEGNTVDGTEILI